MNLSVDVHKHQEPIFLKNWISYDFHLNREQKFKHHGKETKTVFRAPNKLQRLIYYCDIPTVSRDWT